MVLVGDWFIVSRFAICVGSYFNAIFGGGVAGLFGRPVGRSAGVVEIVTYRVGDGGFLDDLLGFGAVLFILSADFGNPNATLVR